MNPKLLAVAIELLDEHGWEALSLDRVADRAGVSRATVWRQGITRNAVDRVLRQRLAADYRELMWVPLTQPGTGAERLASALRALCEVAERNLALLAHTDTAFHGPDLDAAGVELDFFSPWLRLVEAGVADGTLDDPGDREGFVVVLSNVVLLTYVHLRAHHADYGWSIERSRSVVDLVAEGYLPRR